jgi:hypothetical protein
MFTVAQYFQTWINLSNNNSSRKIVAKIVQLVIFCLHLILHTCVQTFDVMDGLFLFGGGGLNMIIVQFGMLHVGGYWKY